MSISKRNLKFMGAIVGVSLAAALAGGCLSLSAAAEEQESSDASLFAPASYEQYLSLDSPSVAAFSAGHIAIADGETLYIYDRTEGAYSETELPSDNSVTQLGFAGERLFVSTRSVSNYFYEYNFETAQFDLLTGINFSTFCIEGNTLYTANVGGNGTTIASYSIADLTDGAPVYTNLGTVRPYVTPYMAILGGKLYCAFGYTVYYQNDEGLFDNTTHFNLSSETAEITDVRSVCSLGENLYYTAADGLYRTDTEENAERMIEGEDYSALTSFDGSLYVIQGNTIKEFAPKKDGAAFTGYEISASSSSLNRLFGAVDSARGGTLLVTADAGNHRVSVYDFATGKFAQILGGDGFAPTHVATDGALIAAVSDNTIYTCVYSSGAEMQFTKAETPSDYTIHGIACVYGAVYFVTGNSYQKLGGEAVFHDGYGSPAALASDVYGDLLVVYDNRTVVRFTEGEFLDKDAAGEKLEYSLPEGYRSLRADFEGNLYYLVGSTLLRNGGEEIATINGTNYVHTMSEGTPSAFALGYEDDEVYFLFGDYIVRSRCAAIPTLKEIDCGGVREAVFTPHATEHLFVEIPAGTVGIRTDLSALREEGPACFPYEFYFRTEENARGILLGQKDGFALVTLYEVGENSREFTVSLFRIDPEADGLLVPSSDYWTENAYKAFLTSDVSVYFFPCLPPALADARLSRGCVVSVMGTVKTPFGADYALIEYETLARTLSRGYIPVSYLADIPSEEPESEEYLFGTLKKAEAGYEFASADGEKITLHGGERIRLTANEDGTYTARYTSDDGKTYTATLERSSFDFGENDALRISLIVILSVLAVLIVGLYIFLLPRKKKENSK